MQSDAVNTEGSKPCLSREASCLNEVSRTDLMGNYSGTISVSPYIMVMGTRYNKYGHSDQKRVIMHYLCEHIGCNEVQLKEKGIMYRYELTQKNNIHCHLLFAGWELESMLRLQTFLSIKFGYQKDPIDRAFYFEKTRVSTVFWTEYMNKEDSLFYNLNKLNSKPIVENKWQKHIGKKA